MFLLGLLFVELVVPALVVGVLAVITAALRRAARDRHDCAGHLGRALAWGGLWAAIYTVPFALLALLVRTFTGT